MTFSTVLSSVVDPVPVSDSDPAYEFNYCWNCLLTGGSPWPYILFYMAGDEESMFAIPYLTGAIKYSTHSRFKNCLQ